MSDGRSGATRDGTLSGEWKQKGECPPLQVFRVRTILGNMEIRMSAGGLGSAGGAVEAPWLLLALLASA